jgi:molybdopterin/thiamine biosynthesis adenylyltransferase
MKVKRPLLAVYFVGHIHLSRMDLTRNYLFINEHTQSRLKACKVLIIGVGLGSFIAEALVRLGVEHLCVCDGDTVSESNLNRQNYTSPSVGHSKAESLKIRLLEINPRLDIESVNHFLDVSHMEVMIPKYDFVVNTIDFDSPAFFSCHELCHKFSKVEFFPMNLGFGLGLFVFKGTFFDNSFSKEKIINYVVINQNRSSYIKEKLSEYFATKREYDPQLIVGTLSNSALICTVLCQLLDDQEVKLFPKFYFLDLQSL